VAAEAGADRSETFMNREPALQAGCSAGFFILSSP
jgi:hypothetical protein